MRHEPFDVKGLIPLEVGGYQPLLGQSFPEIAAASRSMHKSQGFGVEVRRGERKEYFQFLDGEPVPEGSGIFAGIDTNWSRWPESDGISDEINRVLQSFEDTAPWKSVPALIELRKKLRGLGDDSRLKEKIVDLDEIVGAVSRAASCRRDREADGATGRKTWNSDRGRQSRAAST